MQGLIQAGWLHVDDRSKHGRHGEGLESSKSASSFREASFPTLCQKKKKKKLLLTPGKVSSSRNCNQSDVGSEKEGTPGRGTERPLGRDRSFRWGHVWVGSQECPEKHWLPMPRDTKRGTLKETPVQAQREAPWHLLLTLLASIDFWQAPKCEVLRDTNWI